MGSWVRGAITLASIALAGACGTSSSTSVNPNAPSSGRCAVTATAQPTSVGAPGGSGSITVATNRECAWEAASEVEWLSLGSTRAGQGDGTVAFNAASNPVVSERRGAVVINGLRVEIGQAAAACVFGLDRNERTVAAAGGRHDVAVSAQPGCAWTATSQTPWISIASGPNGQGAGVVGVSVQPNTSPAARTGMLTIAGQTYTVLQAAAGTTPTDPGCGFTLSASSATFPSEGGAGEIAVTAASPSCTWAASSSHPWVTIQGPAGGTGSGVLRYTVAASTVTTARFAALTIAGQTVEIIQAALGAPPPAPPAPTPPAPTPPAPTPPAPTPPAPAPPTPDPTPPAPAPPTPTPPAPAPPAPAPPACTFTVAPLSGSFPAAGGPAELAITASAPTCTWTAAAGAPWITLGASGGTGSGRLAYTVAPSSDTAPRSSAITVAGATVAISQAAAAPACTYTLDRQAVTVSFVGDNNVEIRVDTNTGCAWTAASNAPWITVTSGASGTGDGATRFAVAAHLAGSGRVGTLTIAGQAVTVTQGGILNEEVTISGTIANVSGSCPNRTFTVSGTRIAANGSTTYQNNRSCSDLRDGRSVRVRGRGQSDGSLVAIRIDRLSGGDDDEDDDDDDDDLTTGILGEGEE